MTLPSSGSISFSQLNVELGKPSNAQISMNDAGVFGDPSSWVQTSYNTYGGVHYGPDGLPDDKPPLRKNYAGVGYRYDEVMDAFIPPKVFDSWVLNEDTCLWEAPIPYPTDGKPYYWNEEVMSWVEVIPPAQSQE